MSMEEMKNSIKVITEKDNKFTVQKVLRDEDSISKYGLLQEVIKIDPERKCQYCSNTESCRIKQAEGNILF